MLYEKNMVYPYVTPINNCFLTIVFVISLLFLIGCKENHYSWDNMSCIEIMMKDSTQSIEKSIALTLTKEGLECQIGIDSLNELKLNIQYLIPLNHSQKSSIIKILNCKYKEHQNLLKNEGIHISLFDKYKYSIASNGFIIDEFNPLYDKCLVLKEYLTTILSENYCYSKTTNWQTIKLEQKIQEIDYWSEEKPLRNLLKCTYEISKDSVSITGDYDFEKEYDYSVAKKAMTNELLSHINSNNTCITNLYMHRHDSIPDTLKLYVDDKLIYQINTNYSYLKTKYDIHYSKLVNHLQNIRSIIDVDIE